MLLLIKFAAKILSILNGEISPRQISAGLAFGAVIGLVPVSGFLPLILLLIAFLININLPMMFVSAAIFKLISFLIDPIANLLGFKLLVSFPFLKSFWTTLYNTPVVPFSRYNNTIVLGSLVIGVVLLIPLYLIGQVLIVKYRTSWREKIFKIKLVQILKASSFYKYYLSYRGFTGD